MSLPSLPQGYELLLEGEVCVVAINVAAAQKIRKSASNHQIEGLRSLVRRFCSGEKLPSGKFNGNEGRHPDAGVSGNILLQAFKPFQLRAYGFVQQFNGRSIFFITGVDTAKKQNKANQTILDNAGRTAYELNLILKGE
jgi:hypothetical protein